MGQPEFDPTKPFDRVAPAKSAPEFDPTKPFEATTHGPGGLQTAIEHGANMATLGYLPQLQAAAAKPIYGLLNAQFGLDVHPDDYVKERDQNIQRLEQEKTENPKSAMAGKVAGILGGAAMTPGPALTGGLMNTIGKSALYGGAIGAAQNPGDKKGVVDPVQADERIEGAEQGAKVGALAGTASGLVSKGLNALTKTGDAASEQAVRSGGAMLKDFRQLNGRGQTEDVGQWMLDNKIVSAGDKFEDVAAKAKDMNKSSGEVLDALYKKAKGAIPKYLEDSSENLGQLSDKEFKGLAKVGFNPVRDGKSIVSAAKKGLGDAEGANSAVSRLQSYVEGLAEKYGDKTLDPRKANEIKSAMDKVINYSRNPLTKAPEVEGAFSTARRFLADKIEEHIDALGKSMGDEKMAEALKAANRDYGYSKQVMNMAADKVNRESANRIIGLTDTIAGGAAGSAAAAMGDTSAHKGELGAGGFVAGALLNKFGRNYGPGLLATGLNRLAPVAEPIGKYGGLLLKSGVPAAAATRYGTSK